MTGRNLFSGDDRAQANIAAVRRSAATARPAMVRSGSARLPFRSFRWMEGSGTSASRRSGVTLSMATLEKVSDASNAASTAGPRVSPSGSNTGAHATSP